MLEFYENYIVVPLRTYSYFLITFFYLFWGANSLYYKRYWECFGALSVAIFMITLFVTVITKNRAITLYFLSPFLFFWMIFCMFFFYNLFRRAYGDYIKHYIEYIKKWIGEYVK